MRSINTVVVWTLKVISLVHEEQSWWVKEKIKPRIPTNVTSTFLSRLSRLSRDVSRDCICTWIHPWAACLSQWKEKAASGTITRFHCHVLEDFLINEPILINVNERDVRHLTRRTTETDGWRILLNDWKVMEKQNFIFKITKRLQNKSKHWFLPVVWWYLAWERSHWPSGRRERNISVTKVQESDKARHLSMRVTSSASQNLPLQKLAEYPDGWSIQLSHPIWVKFT